MRARSFGGKGLVILLAGAVMRLWRLGSASLWTDEVTTRLRAQASISGCLDSVLASGNQTPLYFLMINRLPNHNELLLRLPSALLGVFGIALMIFVVLRLYGSANLALTAGALIAFNPYHVWLSRTARPYALVFVLALAISYLFLTILRGHGTRWHWIGFVLCSMAAYMTHAFLLALPVVQYTVLILTSRRERPLVRRWFIAQTIAAIPLAIWAGFLVANFDQVRVGGQWIPTPGVPDLLLTLWNMTVGYEGGAQWFMLPGLVIALGGLAIGLAKVARARRDNPEGLYWMVLIVYPLVGVFGLSISVVSLYVDRYFMILLPALILLVLSGLARLPRPLWRPALGVIVLTGAVSIVSILFSGDYQRENWQEVAAYLEQRQQPGDVMVTDNPSALQAFDYYFVPHTPAPLFQLGEVSGDALTRDLPTSGRVWAIYRNPIEDIHRLGVMPTFDPFRADRSPLGAWLASCRDRVTDQHAFNGITVLLVEGCESASAVAAQPSPAGSLEHILTAPSIPSTISGVVEKVVRIMALRWPRRN
jgi:uncharacterized membrane protein